MEVLVEIDDFYCSLESKSLNNHLHKNFKCKRMVKFIYFNICIVKWHYFANYREMPIVDVWMVLTEDLYDCDISIFKAWLTKQFVGITNLKAG